MLPMPHSIRPTSRSISPVHYILLPMSHSLCPTSRSISTVPHILLPMSHSRRLASFVPLLMSSFSLQPAPCVPLLASHSLRPAHCVTLIASRSLRHAPYAPVPTPPPYIPCSTSCSLHPPPMFRSHVLVPKASSIHPAPYIPLKTSHSYIWLQFCC